MKKTIVRNIPFSIFILCSALNVNAKSNGDSIPPDTLRAHALNYFFGISEFNEPACKSTIYQLAKSGDIKAMGWQALFNLEGACGYNKSSEDAHFWMNRGNTYSKLQEQANMGDVESMFLYAELNIKTEAITMAEYEHQELRSGDKLLRALTDRNFLPALYFYPRELFSRQQYDAGIGLLRKCYAQGYNRAGFSLALAYETLGGSILKMPPDSVKLITRNIYTNLIAKGSYEAILHVAEQKINSPDNSERILANKMINQAISKGNIRAMIFLGNYYLSEGDHTLSNAKAVDLFRKAIAAGDVSGAAKLCLSTLYLKSSDAKYKKISFDLLYKAALEDNKDACYILSKMYKDSTSFVGRNEIISNYWHDLSYGSKLLDLENAKLRKSDNKDDLLKIIQAKSVQALINDFWDYEPTVTKRTEVDVVTGQVREITETSDIVTDMMMDVIGTVLINAFANAYLQPAIPLIDQITLLKTKIRPDSSAYVSSYLVDVHKTVTIDSVKSGDIITMDSYTVVNLKQYLTMSITADGYDGLMFKSVVKKYPWGAALFSINNKDYQFAGSHLKGFNMPEDGTFNVLINDKDGGINSLKQSFRFTVLLARPIK